MENERTYRTATELADVLAANNRILERIQLGEYAPVRWFVDASGRETFIAKEARQFGILGLLSDDVFRRRMTPLQTSSWQAECQKFFGLNDWARARQGNWSAEQLTAGLIELHRHLIEEIKERVRRDRYGSH